MTQVAVISSVIFKTQTYTNSVISRGNMPTFRNIYLHFHLSLSLVLVYSMIALILDFLHSILI